MLEELEEKEKQLILQCFCEYKEKNRQKILKHFFFSLGGGQLFVDFRISRGSWNLTPAKSEG
jgi:hypothetical protein